MSTPQKRGWLWELSRASADNVAAQKEHLADGWEPFAVAAGDGYYFILFKRPARPIPESSKEDET